MTRSELISIIHATLTHKMALPNLEGFGEHALLNELGLDSVTMLELLVHLELEHGIALPEEAALDRPAGTVGSLADSLLAGRSLLTAPPGHGGAP